MSINSHLGRTAGGRYTRRVSITSDLFTDAPNARYWDLASGTEQDALVAALGNRAAYRAWAELVWPNGLIDRLTWMQIYLDIHAAVELLHEAPQSSLASLARQAVALRDGECNCYIPGQSCPVCQITQDAADELVARHQHSTMAEAAA